MTITSARREPDVTSSRKWTVATLFGIALWIGAIAVAGSRYSTPSDSSAMTATAVAGGAIFFGCLFMAAGIGIARSKRRGVPELFERLALTPVPRGALRELGRRARLIGYTYVGLGAIITGLMLGVVAIGDTERARPLILAMMALLGVWLVVMVVALRHIATMSSAAFAPLGLVMTGLPQIHVSVIAHRTWLSGAVTYGGTRHGRTVTIMQNAKGAATLIAVGGISGATPSTPIAMAQLTGEPVTSWRGVEVGVEDGALLVLRTGGAAGGWMLHDLLLAEAVADELQPVRV